MINPVNLYDIVFMIPPDSYIRVIREIRGENLKILGKAGSEEIHADDKEKILDDCVRRVKDQLLKNRRDLLHCQIKDAQESGEEEKLRRLMAEFNELTKTRKKQDKT